MALAVASGMSMGARLPPTVASGMTTGMGARLAPTVASGMTMGARLALAGFGCLCRGGGPCCTVACCTAAWPSAERTSQHRRHSWVPQDCGWPHQHDRRWGAAAGGVASPDLPRPLAPLLSPWQPQRRTAWQQGRPPRLPMLRDLPRPLAALTPGHLLPRPPASPAGWTALSPCGCPSVMPAAWPRPPRPTVRARRPCWTCKHAWGQP